MRKLDKYIERDPSFYKKVATVAIPIILQSLITMSVNLLDTIMLGQLGETAIAASALGNQFINLFQTCCMGIGMGATVLIARYWGQKDMYSLKKAITISLRVAIALGLCFAIFNFTFPDVIMSIYTNEEAIISVGIEYLRWSTPTFILMGLSLVTTQLVRSVGKGKIPLIASIVALFVNLIGNYAFIFGKLGAPELGVVGAAIGTVLARLVECAIIMGMFLVKDKLVGYRIKNLLMPCGDLVKEYMRIAMPVLVSDGLLGIGNSAVAMIIGRMGAAFVSANSITSVTMMLSTTFLQGLSFSGNVITGYTLGEGRPKDAQRQGYTFLIIGLVVGCFAAAFIMLSSDLMISFYDITEETRLITKELMRAISWIIFFQAGNNILTKGVLRGGGDTKFLMVADILFLWIVSIPLGYVAGLVLGLPAFWIYFCLKLDQVIKAIWCVFRLRSGKWIKKIKNAGQT